MWTKPGKCPMQQSNQLFLVFLWFLFQFQFHSIDNHGVDDDTYVSCLKLPQRTPQHSFIHHVKPFCSYSQIQRNMLNVLEQTFRLPTWNLILFSFLSFFHSIFCLAERRSYWLVLFWSSEVKTVVPFPVKSAVIYRLICRDNLPSRRLDLQTQKLIWCVCSFVVNRKKTV